MSSLIVHFKERSKARAIEVDRTRKRTHLRIRIDGIISCCTNIEVSKLPS